MALYLGYLPSQTKRERRLDLGSTPSQLLPHHRDFRIHFDSPTFIGRYEAGTFQEAVRYVTGVQAVPV